MTDTEKTCFKCDRLLPLDQFYKHAMMRDGHLNKCKECARADSRANRAKRADYYREFDRKRSQQPERRAKVREYTRQRAKRNPEKFRARYAVGNAIRDGRLVREPCEVCGEEKVQAHHEDYTKPLDVRWLCFLHHRQAHGQMLDK